MTLASPPPSKANPTSTLTGLAKTRPPANPSVAITASNGSNRWAANLVKSRLPESRTTSMAKA